jgi:hypothetical protein
MALKGYLICRLTAPISGEDLEEQVKDHADDVKKAADGKANEAANSTKSTYEKITSSFGNWMGGSKKAGAGSQAR